MNITSPLPWRVVPVGMDRAIVQDAEGRQVVGLIARADAALIVRAVAREGRGFGQRTCRSEPPARHPTRQIEEDRGTLRKRLL